MQFKLNSILLALIGFIAIPSGLLAQQSNTNIELKELPTAPKLLPYSNPFVEDDGSVASDSATRENLTSKSVQKDVMEKITEVYRVHIKSMEAQLNSNPVRAEKFIIEGLNGLQDLLDEYPEVQANERFGEVYRSVMTEYRQFYGITNPENKVKGEIFAIQDEMYAEEGDWMKERY
ncbi:MAG TPA: hypothetical protein VK112_00525, partial [Fodinibius sp.]|nr:hypothetical protein [Fodinibius sp.]